MPTAPVTKRGTLRSSRQFGLASIFGTILLVSVLLAIVRLGWIRFLFAGPVGLIVLAAAIALMLTLATVVTASMLDRRLN